MIIKEAQKIKELQDFMKIINPTVSREEISKAFSSLMAYVKEWKGKDEQEKLGFTKFILDFKRDIQKSLDDTRGIVVTSQQSIANAQKDATSAIVKIEGVDKRVDKVENSLDELAELPYEAIEEAKSDIERDIIDSLVALIPKWGNLIRIALEKLKKGNKLSINAIEGLRGELNELKQRIKEKADRGWSVGRVGESSSVVFGELVTNKAQSGTNVILTWSHTPVQLSVYRNGQQLTPGAAPAGDYTTSSNQTTVFNVDVGEIFIGNYTY